MLFNTPAPHVPHVTEIAEMNLISACGLPGTAKMSIGEMLATLDAWAKRVRDHTQQNVGKYLSGVTKFPSLAQFRVAAMIYVLTRHIGVRYNPAQVGSPDPNPPPMDDPEDAFIHGVLGPRKTGTCASLPVLLVAVGRRLGYPLKLVHSLAHCFCRWDAPDERFNIEWHEGGLNVHPDDYYKRWPFEWNWKIHQRERERPTLLISLAPQQELAGFALHRAAHLDLANRRDEAYASASVAYRLWPTHGHAVWMNHLLTKKAYPDRDFPHMPCEETASAEAIERLKREKGARMMQVSS